MTAARLSRRRKAHGLGYPIAEEAPAAVKVGMGGQTESLRCCSLSQGHGESASRSGNDSSAAAAPMEPREREGLQLVLCAVKREAQVNRPLLPDVDDLADPAVRAFTWSAGPAASASASVAWLGSSGNSFVSQSSPSPDLNGRSCSDMGCA